MVANGQAQAKRLYASDRSKDFHTQPMRIKEILYLDQPDIILTKSELGHEAPFASLEISEEAGSGHNGFQRFGRVAAAAERGVAAFYIYPEAIWVGRRKQGTLTGTWDQINPNVYLSLERLMSVHGVPALLYHFPTDFAGDRHQPPGSNASPKGQLYDAHHAGCPSASDASMRNLVDDIDQVIKLAMGMPTIDVGRAFLTTTAAQDRRTWMMTQYANGLLRKPGDSLWSPVTAAVEIETADLLSHLSAYAGANHDFGDLLASRTHTVIYQADSAIRSDPYAGALAAIDYLLCGRGKTYEQREKNLVIAWGSVSESEHGIQIAGRASVNDFVDPIRTLYTSPTGPVKLGKTFSELKRKNDIPRYMMQVRYGTMFTKSKEARMFAYIADALLFEDGALWREA